MTYQHLIEKLYSLSLHGGMKLGLSNIHKLSQELAHPDQKFSSIHIAGTNGKGSVSKKMSAALQYSGKKVGLYTSPHISCFRERIQINGVMISEKDIVELLPIIFKAAESNGVPATFFEITTLLAFLYFAQEDIDIAVLETGLGGRLDATNIVTPILSVITSISLDHTEILGNTVEEIAKEKAAIIKAEIPVVIGPRTPQHYFKVYADAIHSPCVCVDGAFENFEEENNAIAKAALEVLKVPVEAISAGLQTRLPCRMELISAHGFNNIILDVAHNPDGLQHLFSAVKNKWPNKKLRVVCGLSKSKDLTSCLGIIANYAIEIHLVEAKNQRGAPVKDLQAILDKLRVPITSNANNSISEAVQEAIQKAKRREELLIICGTFFIMSEVRAALGINEPRDPMDLQ